MPLRYWVLIFILGMGWGASFFLNAILLRELGPLSVSMLRIALGALGCWVWLAATGGLVPVSLRQLGQMLVLGLFFYGVPLSVYPLAQQHIGSGAAGIVNALTPVMVVIVSHLWPGGEKATALKSLGVLAGFAGIALLALPALRSGGGAELWAILFAALAPLCYAVAMNHARSIKGMPPTALTAWSLTLATLILTPLALWREGVPQITQPQTWAALGVIGFVLTSAAFILLYWLLPRVGATATSTVTFIAPVSAVVLGVFVLKEELHLPQMIGMLVIFAGLIAIDGRLLRRLYMPRVKPDHQPDG
ncbi:DMT family transporter [Actibacterium sp. XHP0104]|uniref:DMT family transporter n=1 Tax=Actibacterium sp. XHP0104 TaxID=2984335 RepID=UPI0021E7A67E|nr:DMT family transporter [Actibacterium sp. XHP0104]MCV2882348.1 DMT family transporter [Actibacterium sp. XHP0104]